MRNPVAVAVSLCAAFLLACATVKSVPSPDSAMKNGVLAYAISFSHRSALGTVLDADTGSDLRYARAVRMVGGKLQPESAITTDIVSGTILLFVDVAPGEYVLTDFVFARNVGHRRASESGSIDVTGSVTQLIAAVLPENDAFRTAAVVEPGSVCYGGRFDVRAESSLTNIMPYYDSDKRGIRNILINKGYAPSSAVVDCFVSAAAVQVSRSSDDAAYFKTKASALLAGSGWEKQPVSAGK